MVRFTRILVLFSKKSKIYRLFFIISNFVKGFFAWLLFLLVIVTLFSVSGIELFASKLADNQGKTYRINFENPWNAFLSSFIVIAGDKWPELMGVYYNRTGVRGIFYCLSLVLVGNVLLVNMLVSVILANSLSNANKTVEDEEMDIESINLRKRIKRMKYALINWAKKLKEWTKSKFDNNTEIIGLKELEKKISNSKKRAGLRKSAETNALRRIDTLASPEKALDCTVIDSARPVLGRSLLFFSKENKIRRILAKITDRNKIFQWGIFVSIVLSLIVVALDSPTLGEGTFKTVLFNTDLALTVIFTVEAVGKIIAFGLVFNGTHSYLRNVFDFIDFTSVVLSIWFLFSHSETELSADLPSESAGLEFNRLFRIIKIFRIIRTFKVISTSDSLKATFKAIYLSMVQLAVVSVFCLMILISISIITNNYLKSKFHRCSFQREEIITKQDCFDFGGQWNSIVPNFDSVFSSLLTLLQVATNDNWVAVMHQAIDGVNSETDVVLDKNYGFAFFFCLLVIVGYFAMFNTFIGVLADNYSKVKDSISKSDFRTRFQIDMLSIFKSITKISLPSGKSNDSLREKLLFIVDSIYFDSIVTACIVGNTLTLTLNWSGMEEKHSEWIAQLGHIFVYIFISEAVLKIYCFRLDYFASKWNILDFCVFLESVISIVLDYFGASSSGLFFVNVKILRIGRILKLLKKNRTLNKIFNTFNACIPGVLNICTFYFLFTYVYAVVGMNIFYNVVQSEENKNWNFRTFGDSFLLLTRATLGSGWTEIMVHYGKARSDNHLCFYTWEISEQKAMEQLVCGSVFAYPFFISYVLVSRLLFLQFFNLIISVSFALNSGV